MNTQEYEPTLVIQPRRALYLFGGIGILVVILSFIGQYLFMFPDTYNIRSPFEANLIRDFISEFNFHGQPNISIYYNLLGLNAASFFLFVIAHFKKISKDKYWFHWAAMAWIVLVVSIDNLAIIRNKIVEYYQDSVNSAGSSPYGWMIAGILVAVVLIIFFFQFWLRLENKYRILFVTSIFIYFIGALIKAYSLLPFTALEQVLHYGGVTLLLYSVLHYMESHISWFSVSTK